MNPQELLIAKIFRNLEKYSIIHLFHCNAQFG